MAVVHYKVHTTRAVLYCIIVDFIILVGYLNNLYSVLFGNMIADFFIIFFGTPAGVVLYGHQSV